jgi:ribonuclease HIII
MEEQVFTFSQPPHTLFSGKKKGISCTLYTSGKLMVQGKEMAEFIEFYLEPHILQSVAFTYRDTSVDPTERIGVDESGKGDFFGPLCIAGVYAAGDGVANLVKMGVKDSKKLNDAAVLKLAKEITRSYVHSIVRISPKRYNELYQQFRNLNSLLAWGHATVIENLATKTKSPKAVVDQFAAKYVVESALKRKHIEIELCQQHRAESDPVVAAASILARAAFLEGLAALGSQYGVSLPKGASKETVEAAKAIYASQGVSVFDDICKLHFKTFQTIVGADSGNNLRRSWGSLQDDQEMP